MYGFDVPCTNNEVEKPLQGNAGNPVLECLQETEFRDPSDTSAGSKFHRQRRKYLDVFDSLTHLESTRGGTCVREQISQPDFERQAQANAKGTDRNEPESCRCHQVCQSP